MTVRGKTNWLGILVLALPAAAQADTLPLTCGKSRLTIDTARPSVVVHYSSGFSQVYENGTRSSSYQFLDGASTPYTSTVTVTVSDREVDFVERYETASGVNLIKNALDRKTLVWRADQNGRVTATQCAK